ncbi:hypothetical protein K7X08_024735 [Anisodus acutangulus]|uniref:Uncharacterized protein n=1 Tax=Anisodus acutangulus TaxID=402998 RepID=A0A9Q1MC58_9SOLA|nr:hypothetical protein K7X08_024735 [Anisodus acutangulus]
MLCFWFLLTTNVLYLPSSGYGNADKSCLEPRLRLKAFFGSLYRCLGRGARAVLQVYPENIAQLELILGFAMRAGFSGGIVVDYPHNTKWRKEYLVLTCGPQSLSSVTPEGKSEDGETCSDEDSSGDEENQTLVLDFEEIIAEVFRSEKCMVSLGDQVVTFRKIPT